jgi:Zn-dependent protease with chaperone function
MTRVLVALLFAAQTVIVPPDNKYTPADDVKLGLQAADQVERKMPVMSDDALTSYVAEVGQRLVDAIPEAFRHAEFHYTFKVVNVREINAFALPGGPMFVNRGMLEAAKNEGEVAGVMAHEISHVVLRHGTAQASKATKYEGVAVAGAVIGAILGGGLGRAVSATTQFGVETRFLKFGRDFERQADLEGSHLMASAGYDPRDMANFFKTIQQQGGSNGPEWLSDHPDPGNRYETILKEAQSLKVENPLTDTRAFEQVQTHLRRLPRAPTSAEASRAAAGSTTRSGGTPPSGIVEPPSARSTQYAGNLFRISVPSNWRELRGSDSITFAPLGGFGTVNGRSIFTHGVEISITRSDSRDLQNATDDLIGALSRGNAELRRSGEAGDVTLSGHRGLRTRLSNRSEATGQFETIEVFTTLLRDRNLFYLLTVAPADAFQDYASTFDRLVESLRLND